MGEPTTDSTKSDANGPTPPPPPDPEREKWLTDPALTKYMHDFAKSQLDGDDSAARDLCQDALELTLPVLRGGGGPPTQGDVRPWITAFLKNLAAERRRESGKAVHLSLDDVKDLPLEDLIAAHLALWRKERLLTALEDEKSKKPEHAKRIERALEGARVRGPMNVAERAAASRSRRILRAAVLATAGLTAILFFGVVRTTPEALGVAPLNDLTNLERARVLRESGLHACGQRQWTRCMEELDHARELDPKGDESPVVQEERRQANLALHPMSAPEIAAVRDNALQDCTAHRWADCLDGLDQARLQDPAGDLTPDITVARSKAAHGLRDAAPKDDIAKPGPGDPRKKGTP